MISIIEFGDENLIIEVRSPANCCSVDQLISKIKGDKEERLQYVSDGRDKTGM